MKIYPNENLSKITSVSHDVFKYVENRFWNWLNNSNPAMEYKEQYFGEDAINDKKGAIQQAIENALDYANEIDKPIDLDSFDLECAFE